eukprot:4033210-Alexandrium_andersonii.AAC.1
MNDLSCALCLSTNIAPLTDPRLAPGLDLPEPIPLLPECCLRIGVLDDLLSPDRSGNEEVLGERNLGDSGAVLTLQPRAARWRPIR